MNAEILTAILIFSVAAAVVITETWRGVDGRRKRERKGERDA